MPVEGKYFQFHINKISVLISTVLYIFGKIVKSLNLNYSGHFQIHSSKKINNDFDISESKFNAHKAKKKLSAFENKYIKKRLSKYLQW